MLLGKRTSRSLAIWYRSKVKPFLLKEYPFRVEQLSRELEALETLEKKLDEETSFCFVGASGIGKSTLINALVAGGDFVVPNGGVGPLTAQAIEISYCEVPSFHAIYHSPASLWKIGFALESAIKRESETAISADDDGELEELIDIVTASELANNLDNDGMSKTEIYKKQAQLLITGKQGEERELKYLVDSIREAMGKPRKYATELAYDDRERVSRLKTIFNTEHKREESIYSTDTSNPGFRKELEDHAAGYLSPVIKELDVRWNSELLADGVKLVDLPGLGVAGDVYREVSDKWVRNHARALILVVNNRGIQEADAHLLRTSGFLTRLLHSVDDHEADPVALMVAVVRADETAANRWEQERANTTDRRNCKSKAEHLVDVLEDYRKSVSQQIRTCISQAWSNGGEEIGDGKLEVINRICESLVVCPMSTVEYRRFLIDDEDDRSFLKNIEQSGVPTLSRNIAELRSNTFQRQATAFNKAWELLFERIASQLKVVEENWSEKSRVQQEMDKLRTELDSFIGPLREEFRARQGGFHTYLKETIPQSIESVVNDACLKATRAMNSQLRTLGNAHWNTLQAAVKRDGVFQGARKINLPNDFAMAFEDPIAEKWSKDILGSLRKRTMDYIDDCSRIIQKMSVWVESQTDIKPALLQAQRDSIQGDMQFLASVGRNAVEGLRESVQAELCKAIQDPIQRGCQDFIRQANHRGAGVQQRVLELFSELVNVAVDTARAPAKNILQSNYRKVVEDILDVLRQQGDPIQKAAEAIVESHEEGVQRSDSVLRQRVFDELAEIIEAAPSDEYAGVDS